MKVVNPAKLGRINPADWRQYEAHYTESIWPADLPHKPSEYGTPQFHGRTHPEIVYVSLMRYTKPGDLVWDCFAGGGTTLDVCKELGNPCIANDINPTRTGIIPADSAVWRPDQQVDLVIMHPPYMDCIKWPGEKSLSVGNIDDFYRMMFNVVQNVTPVLKIGHVLVLIVGQVYKDGQLYMLDCELYPCFMDNYRVLGRVVRGFGETKGGASGNKNQGLWRYRRLAYGLWDLGIDTVLFYQRVA